MNEAELLKILNSSGIRFVYHHWPEKDTPPLPYGAYLLVDEPTTFYADGEMYYRIARYQVELYAKAKSPKAEKQLEAALIAAGISFQKSETILTARSCMKLFMKSRYENGWEQQQTKYDTA